MTKTTYLRALVAVLVGLAVAACGARQGGGGSGPAQIQVINNIQPPTTLSVYLSGVMPTMGPRLIGTVPAGDSAALRVSQPFASGEYRVMVRTIDGTELVSPGFPLGEGDAVRWDVSANTVRDATMR